MFELYRKDDKIREIGQASGSTRADLAANGDRRYAQLNSIGEFH